MRERAFFCRTAMTLDAQVLMVRMVMVVMVITSVPVSGAPLVVGARLQVMAGGNATCPWTVSLQDAAGDGGGRQLCTGELGISFGDTPNDAAFPTTSSYSNVSSETPLEVATEPTQSNKGSKCKSEMTGRPEAEAGPPRGYECVGGVGFYKLHIRARMWQDARAVCEQEGAHLLVLDSAAEARALRRFLATKGFGHVYRPTYTLHAGFRLDLVTPQGERVMYESWSILGPQSRFCGQIDNDVWMLYGNCSDWRLFICEYDPRARTSSAIPASSPLPLPDNNSLEINRQLMKDRGYAPLVGWNRTYIKDMGLINSWNEAKKICENDGAQMVTIDSDEKADALFAFIESSNITESFYIGVKTGLPVTVLGEPLEAKGYQRWSTKEHQGSCFLSNTRLQYVPSMCDSLISNHSAIPRSLCQVNVI